MISVSFLIPLIVGVLVGAFVLALVWAGIRWNSATSQCGARLENSKRPFHPKVVSATQMENLPAPVQRYLHASLTEGLPCVADMEVEQTGEFNQSETLPSWKPFTATQRVVTWRPGYFWDARIKMFPGVPIHVRDAYIAGEGYLQAAVFGLFFVANMRDSGDLAKGELQRYLAEMAWYPTAFLQNLGVRWDAVDDQSARATLSDGRVTASLLFRFNADGLIDSFRADARGRTLGGETVPLPWEGRFWNYVRRSGMLVPLEGEVAWIHPDGAKPYWRGRITKFSYGFVK